MCASKLGSDKWTAEEWIAWGKLNEGEEAYTEEEWLVWGNLNALSSPEPEKDIPASPGADKQGTVASPVAARKQSRQAKRQAERQASKAAAAGALMLSEPTVPRHRNAIRVSFTRVRLWAEVNML